MLLYLAHIPHSPLILKNISKDKFSDFKNINKAIKTISEEIKNSDCDTIVTISSFSYRPCKTHVLNVSPKFDVFFSKYGDFSTKAEAFGEIPLAYHLRKGLQDNYSISSITSNELDTPSSVAFFKTKNKEKKYKILPFSQFPDSSENLFNMGKEARDVFENSKNKIAVISLGDFSRTEKGQDNNMSLKNDQELLENIKNSDFAKFISTKEEKIKNFSVRAFGPLAMAMGIVDGINSNFEILKYEQKHGVGMLVSKFAI